MKINSYILSAIALGAVLTSCQKDNLEGTGEVSGEVRKVTISAAASTDQTRTSIYGLKVSWIGTDKLGVFTATSGAAAEFGNSLGTRVSASADFTGDLTVSTGDDVYAFYPFGSYVANAGTTATFTLPTPQVHKQSDHTSIGAYAFMYGKSTGGANSEGNFSMEFQHLMSIVDFKITRIPKTVKIHSLVLRADAAPLFATTAVVDIENNSAVLTGSVNEIKVDVKNSTGQTGVVTANGSLSINLAMLPQEMAATHNWSIDIYTEEEAGTVLTKTINKSITTTDNKELGAGNRYSIPINYKHAKDPTKGYAVGDPYPNAENPIGVVESVDATGKSGKIISLDQANLAFCTINGASVISSSYVDGVANLVVITAKIGTQYTGSAVGNATGTYTWDHFPAVKWCKEKTEGGSGWYLPAVGELELTTEKRTLINSGMPENGRQLATGWYTTSSEADWDNLELLTFSVAAASHSVYGYDKKWADFTRCYKRF